MTPAGNSQGVSPGSPSRLHGLPDRVYAVRLDGELEGDDLAAFEIDVESAIRRGDLAVVVDLRDVEFVASNVINAMFRVCRKLRQIGGAMAIVCTDPSALRIVEVTGLAEAIAVCEDVDAAVRFVVPHAGGFH